MGACAVGSHFSSVGRDHWFKMLELPRKSVAQWYQLSEHVPAENPAASCGSATCGKVFPAGGGNRRSSAVK